MHIRVVKCAYMNLLSTVFSQIFVVVLFSD